MMVYENNEWYLFMYVTIYQEHTYKYNCNNIEKKHGIDIYVHEFLYEDQ